MNNAALKVGYTIISWRPWFQVCWLYTLKSKIAGSYENSLFHYLRNSHYLSIETAPVYIHTSSMWEFYFFYIFTICNYYFLITVILMCVKWSHCSFDLYFLWLRILYTFFWRSEWQPTPIFLPGESHGQSSLVGYSPLCCQSQTQLSPTKTKWLNHQTKDNVVFPHSLNENMTIMVLSRALLGFLGADLETRIWV